MTTPPEQKIIPPHMLIRGPDAIRGSGYAFILTKFPDPEGNRWFIQPGHVGHETMTNSPAMLQALFGPEAKEIADEHVMVRDGYDKMGKPTGQKVEHYDYHEIRRLAKRTNLFGRAGTLAVPNRGTTPVVMLWGAPENWQAMLIEALRHLQTPLTAVVTVGASNQFLASDFLGQDDEAKKAQAGRVDADQTANAGRMQLLAKYHTATGPDKIALARQLGFHQNAPGPRPGSPPDWRAKGRDNNQPYVYSYGERKHPNFLLYFRDFLQG